MQDHATLGTYAASVGLFCILMMIYLIARQRSDRAFNVWLTSAVVGIFLGATGALAVAHLAGYEWQKRAVPGSGGGEGEFLTGATYRGGGPGGGGGIGGGGFQPSPTRELTTLVRKLNLLTSDIAIELTEDQAAELRTMLGSIQAMESISTEEAQAMQAGLKSVLNEAQLASLDKVSLPRTRGGSGGSNPRANPFEEGASAEAMHTLLERLRGGTSVASEP
jgi:hypothetical protein